MSNPIHKPCLVLLLTSVGLMALPHGYHLPTAILAFFFFLWGWRFVCLWKPQWLPHRLALLLLALAGIGLLFSGHSGIFGRDAGTQLFLVALGLKLMELTSKRDLYVVAFLTFVMAASQFLYVQSALMGAYAVAVSGLLLATLVRVNSPFQSSSWPAIKTAGVLLAQALPIAVALFLLFPRFEAPRWAWLKDSHTAQSGLDESMEPGSISALGMSHEVAFRVQFQGQMPPPNQRYWRGPVFSYTDGRRWMPAKNTDLDGPPDRPLFKGQAYRYKLLLEPQKKNWVYALDLPSEFPLSLKQTADYRLLSQAAPYKHAEYELTSMPWYTTGAIAQTELRQNVQLPAKRSEKITRLVKKLGGFEETPQRFIDNVLGYFRTEKFYYSLTPPLLAEDQPLEAFLFETRSGFCSHYAAAFVYMMRLASVPARVVTGYQGGELNPLGGFLEIRQADAHAWAEVWLAGSGWVRVDPTAAIAPERIEQSIDIRNVAPGAVIDFSQEQGMMGAWRVNARQLWGSLDYKWQRWVINYNHKKQSAFLSAWGIGNVRQMLQWLLVGVGLATAVVATVVLWPKSRQHDRLRQVYQKFCLKLARCGLLKGEAEGEGDFALRAGLVLSEKSAQIAEITQIYVGLRYGKQAQVDLTQLRRLVRGFNVTQNLKQ